MSQSPLFSGRRWLLFLTGALLFVAVTDYARWQQLERVTAIGREPANTNRPHWLIIPEHNSRSYQWLTETEQMLTTGQWRVREIHFENAPDGREVHAASPFRWWLGTLAWLDHLISGRSLSQSIEKAAMWSGPLLHIVLLVAGCWFIARRFSTSAAALFSIAIAGLYPLGGEFLPGVPNDRGLVVACAIFSLLLLIAGMNGHRFSFLTSGVAGGIGLWLDASTQVPLLAGIGVGALLLAAYGRFSKDGSPMPALPWTQWAVIGAITSLSAYLVEYFPDHMALRLQVNHPVYALEWIGLGALLTLTGKKSVSSSGQKGSQVLLISLACLGLAALPIAMVVNHSSAFLAVSPDADRLTNLLNGPVASNLAAWLGGDNAWFPKLASGLPLLLILPLLLALRSTETGPFARRAAIVLTGVLVVCLALTCSMLQWGNTTQAALLVLAVVLLPPKNIRAWVAIAAVLLPGVVELAISARVRDEAELTRLEAESLIERDLAHWIVDHSPAADTIFLAAPDLTPGLCFHGKLRGLGSSNWENHEGVAVTTRILSATTSDEAQALFNQRGVTYLIIVSWDNDLDEFVRWTSANPNDSFLSAVHRWALPPWLQPQVYHLPGISGFEGHSAVVFKITDDTDRALSLSRLAEYALEIDDPALAAASNDALQSFPANLIALVSRAQVEKSLNHPQAFEQVAATIRQSVSSGLDRLLPWDRRVSLAVVLAQDNQLPLARAQVQRCLNDLSEDHIRALGTGALYRLLVLTKNFGLQIPQPAHRELMLSLLPANARERL